MYDEVINNIDEYEVVVKWRDAAIADGWICKPLYPKTEPWESACKLEKGGFTAQIISRDRSDKHYRKMYDAVMDVWGPDRLQVEVPEIYDFEVLKKGLRHCKLCGAEDVSTQRYSFAGRCCEKCLPKARKEFEYRGWAD